MLLKRIGGECAGAISILPESEKPESPDQYQYRSLSDEQLSDAILQIPRRPLLAGQDGIRISLAGAQEKLAMSIGGENRPEWIMERHWEKFSEEIKISNTVLRKRLSAFCLGLINKIDITHADFIGRYQGAGLLDDVITAIKKRTYTTLKQFE